LKKKIEMINTTEEKPPAKIHEENPPNPKDHTADQVQVSQDIPSVDPKPDHPIPSVDPKPDPIPSVNSQPDPIPSVDPIPDSIASPQFKQDPQ